MSRNPCFVCGLAIKGYDPIPIPKTLLGRVRFRAGLRVLNVGRRFMRLARTLLRQELEDMES